MVNTIDIVNITDIANTIDIVNNTDILNTLDIANNQDRRHSEQQGHSLPSLPDDCSSKVVLLS